MDAWQLAEETSLRPEAFGGMVFHRGRGLTLEMDGEAYHFLCACREPRALPPPDHPAARLAPQLARLGFLVPAGTGQRGAQVAQDTLWTGDGFTLSAPETIHLAITSRCNLSCPGCYAPRCDAGPELSTTELCDLIEQWARMGVFQLAVGGGEPLLRADLFDVLAHARAQGLAPNLTTNGTRLTPDVIRRLEQAGVARVNLSWNNPPSTPQEGARSGNRGQRRSGARALRMLLASTLQVGVNLLVTPDVLSHLPQTLARLQALGVQRVTILRPKPPAFPSPWYEANRLRRVDLMRLRDVLRRWRGTLHLEVDSALVGLMKETPPALLRWRGVYGCVAGRRICTVWPDGRVTPCSFLADLSAGNVRRVRFAELWKRGENWAALRDPTFQPRGGCVGCEVVSQCGGARCVARYEGGDLLGGDVECPP